MASPLDDVAVQVAALNAEKAQVNDHWKSVEKDLTSQITTYYKAHSSEATRATELLTNLSPPKVSVQVNPAQLVLEGRSLLAKAKAWLKINWRYVAYAVVAGIVGFDVFVK